MNLTHFKWNQDAGGIVTLTWDMPDKPVNTLAFAAVAELGKVAEKVKSDAAIKGLVITSAKPGNFCAGADLGELSAAAGTGPDAAQKVLDTMWGAHQVLRALETMGKPVAAAINGTALGGGLELTLACHYRVASADPKTRLGFPEAQLGLLPGLGGTQRLPRLIGAMQAAPLLLESKRIDVNAAQMQGVIHKVVPAAQLVADAKAWIKANGQAMQPWDNPGYRIPGGGPYSTAGSQVFIVGNAMLRQKTYGNYPAQQAIMSAVYEGLLVDIDSALKIEVRRFVKLLLNPVARNMIRTFFGSMQELGKGARRPKEEPAADVKTLGVLGAGVMGAGIAYVSAMAGINVVLVDTTDEKAKKGYDHAAGLQDKDIGRGRSTPAKKAEILGRIKPTSDFGALKDADLIIEAVFEDRAVKAEATKKADAATKDTTIFGSNTSTLPISGLAEASKNAKSFIGIHFFSPVEKMMLVEIIMGKDTSDRALATAIDYVRKIKKTPIVVNDSRGFYTSRCFSTYTQEGMAMVLEGISPILVENAGKMAGMPMGPFEVTDSVGVDTALKITRQTRKEVAKSDKPDAAEELLAWLVETSGRPGQKAGKGFYEYDERGKAKRLWRDFLDRGAKVKEGGKWKVVDVKELEDRLLAIQALEAARCFEEGVITDPRDADIGSILGWGFAPYTGGAISYIDTMGAAAFVKRCQDFAAKYGARFTPNKLLLDMAAKGETFYQRFAPKKAA